MVTEHTWQWYEVLRVHTVDLAFAHGLEVRITVNFFWYIVFQRAICSVVLECYVKLVVPYFLNELKVTCMNGNVSVSLIILILLACVRNQSFGGFLLCLMGCSYFFTLLLLKFLMCRVCFRGAVCSKCLMLD